MAIDESVPWERGVIHGFSAALVVYGAVTLLLVVQVLALSTNGTGLTTRAFLIGTIGDFFTAHPGSTALVPGIRDAGFVPPGVYTLLVAVVLCWAGYRVPGAEQSDRRTAIATGSSISLGYLPATIGCVIVIWTFDPQLVALDPLRVILVVGVLTPALFGAVGGAFRYATWDGNA